MKKLDQIQHTTNLTTDEFLLKLLSSYNNEDDLSVEQTVELMQSELDFLCESATFRESLNAFLKSSEPSFNASLLIVNTEKLTWKLVLTSKGKLQIRILRDLVPIKIPDCEYPYTFRLGLRRLAEPEVLAKTFIKFFRNSPQSVLTEEKIKSHQVLNGKVNLLTLVFKSVLISDFERVLKSNQFACEIHLLDEKTCIQTVKTFFDEHPDDINIVIVSINPYDDDDRDGRVALLLNLKNMLVPLLINQHMTVRRRSVLGPELSKLPTLIELILEKPTSFDENFLKLINGSV